MRMSSETVAMLPRLNVKDLIILEEIGHGSFAKVRLAQTRTGEKLCVKIVPRSKIAKRKDLEHLSQEVSVLSSIHHPNIVRYLGSGFDDSGFYIFMEYCEGMTLLDYINLHKRLKDQSARNIARKILTVLAFLHSHSIYHRDIKPENIIIMENEDIKLIDFGLCSAECNDYLSTFCGSVKYSAPELILKQPYLGASADIWSAGIVIYAMVLGELPWKNINAGNLTNDIINKPIDPPPPCTPICANLLKIMLNKNPRARPSAATALTHQWFRIGQPTLEEAQPTLAPKATPCVMQFSDVSTKVKYSKRRLLEQTTLRKGGSMDIFPLEEDQNTGTDVGISHVSSLRVGCSDAKPKRRQLRPPATFL